MVGFPNFIICTHNNMQTTSITTLIFNIFNNRAKNQDYQSILQKVMFVEFFLQSSSKEVHLVYISKKSSYMLICVLRSFPSTFHFHKYPTFFSTFIPIFVEKLSF